MSLSAQEAAILAARARQLARPAAPPVEAGSQLEVAVFHRGGEYLGWPTAGVREIQPLRAHRWARVPGAPAFVVGLLNLRGRFYSLIDVPAVWGRPAQAPAETAHLLIVRGADHRELAVLADAVPAVLTLPLAALEPAPARLSARALEHVRGVTAEALLVLDVDRLLADPHLIVSEEP